MYPPRVRVRATVKLSAAFFHDESSITIGGYESAIAPLIYCGLEQFIVKFAIWMFASPLVNILHQ